MYHDLPRSDLPSDIDGRRPIYAANHQVLPLASGPPDPPAAECAKAIAGWRPQRCGGERRAMLTSNGARPR